MKDIIIKMRLFAFKQLVTIKDNKTGNIETYSIPLDEIIDFISKQKDVETVHLLGNEKYI